MLGQHTVGHKVVEGPVKPLAGDVTHAVLNHRRDRVHAACLPSALNLLHECSLLDGVLLVERVAEDGYRAAPLAKMGLARLLTRHFADRTDVDLVDVCTARQRD